MNKFINTDRFRDIAHYKVMLKNNMPFVTNILKNNAIIYCDVSDLNYLFSNLRFAIKKYILITASSDFPVTQQTFLSKPSCIKKWYTAHVTFDHPDFVSIPLGLGPYKYHDACAPDPVTEKSYYIWFEENINKFNYENKDTKKVYCNWKNANNPRKRIGILQKLRNNDIEYHWGRGKEENESEVRYNGISPYIYYEQMAQCKFVIAPPGVAPTDSAKIWEALYMGSFPVVIKDDAIKEWGNLPIIQVNDYSEVTYDLLYSYLDKEYNFERCYMTYWKKRITKEFEKL